MKIVSSHQMRILEQCANQRGVADSAIMENAGLGMARCIRSMFRSITGFQFFVLVGPGNNGGDGLVLARLLRSWGYRVVVAILAKRPGDDPKRALVARQGTLIIDVFNQNPIPDFSTLHIKSGVKVCLAILKFPFVKFSHFSLRYNIHRTALYKSTSFLKKIVTVCNKS